MIDELQFELNRIIEFIKHADTKTAYLTTLNLALVGIWVGKIDFIRQHTGAPYMIFYIGSAILLSFILYYLMRSILPVTSKGKIRKDSLLYFGDISKLEIDDFRKRRLSISKNELKKQYADQIFITSKIAYGKMKYTRRASYCIAFFIILSAVIFVRA